MWYFLPLLERHVEVAQQDRLLEMGYYDPRGALWAARRAAVVVALRPAVDLANDLEQRRQAEALRTLDVRLAVQLEPADAGTFDVALLLAPFYLGNVVVQEALRACAAALRPGGTLYVQVHRRHGGGTYVRFAEALFEYVELLGMGGGQRRLYGARRPRAAGALPALPPAAERPMQEVAVGGVTLRLRLAAGVFAARAVDPGSRLLLDTVRLRPGAAVLDLGCGAGVIGLALAAGDPRARVVLVDSSRAAVDLARANAAANHLANVDVRLGDAYAAVAGERFDCIVSNLPAHRGHHVDTAAARRFIAGAPAHLGADGEAWFVANAALPYEGAAARAFRQVRLAAGGRYKVLHCVGPRPGERP